MNDIAISGTYNMDMLGVKSILCFGEKAKPSKYSNNVHTSSMNEGITC
jgi:hypothetical protein